MDLRKIPISELTEPQKLMLSFAKYFYDLSETLFYADKIYVRAEINGKWGPYSLTELEPEEAMKWIDFWIKRLMLPARIHDESEE